MNEGVKILLERMKTNPEEFTNGTKWAGLIHGYKTYLNAEDAKTLDEAFNELMQQNFTERVMTELLAPEEDNSLGKPWYSNTANVTLGVGQTLGVYSNTSTATGTWTTTTATGTLNAGSVTLGNTKLDETNLQKLLAMKAQMELEKHKAKQVQRTLVGRLKNYLHNE